MGRSYHLSKKIAENQAAEILREINGFSDIKQAAFSSGMDYLEIEAKGQDYSEVMSSSEYLEIMELYADRLKGQIAAVQAQRNTLHIPLDMLGREHCFPLLDGDDIANKVVAINPASLRYEYQRADCQLILVTGESGARSNPRGTAVYGINVFTGRRASQWKRGDILGEVRPECLPQWSKDRLQVIQRERALKRSLSDTR